MGEMLDTLTQGQVGAEGAGEETMTGGGGIDDRTCGRGKGTRWIRTEEGWK